MNTERNKNIPEFYFLYDYEKNSLESYGDCELHKRKDKQLLIIAFIFPKKMPLWLNDVYAKKVVTATTVLTDEFQHFRFMNKKTANQIRMSKISSVMMFSNPEISLLYQLDEKACCHFLSEFCSLCEATIQKKVTGKVIVDHVDFYFGK